MPNNTPRTPAKSTPKYHRLALADLPLEKQIAQREKIAQENEKALAQLRGQLAARNHAKEMEQGAQAILRRLMLFSDKFWTQYSDRLQKLLPEEPDQQHLVYWLEHRPQSKPAEQPPSGGQKSETEASQPPEESAATAQASAEKAKPSDHAQEPAPDAQTKPSDPVKEPAPGGQAESAVPAQDLAPDAPKMEGVNKDAFHD